MRETRRRVFTIPYFPARSLPVRCLASILFLLLFAAPVLGTDVSGTVFIREGTRMVPVFRARVMVRESAGRISAVARTDREGRFAVSGLTDTRITLKVEKERFFVQKANGTNTDSLSLNCTLPADCTNVEFELGLGGVVTGMIRDDLGEPVSGALVSVTNPENAGKEDPGRWSRYRASGRLESSPAAMFSRPNANLEE
jgi:hypothetical protein